MSTFVTEAAFWAVLFFILLTVLRAVTRKYR
jgi:hypothetical protein